MICRVFSTFYNKKEFQWPTIERGNLHKYIDQIINNKVGSNTPLCQKSLKLHKEKETMILQTWGTDLTSPIVQIVFSKTFERHNNGDSRKFKLLRVLEFIDILIKKRQAITRFHAVFNSLNLSVPSR